jgi:hypothetical protein
MPCGSAAAEIIGPYAVSATPVSVTLKSGGGASFTWLNVVNSPLTLQAALTGFSVLDDGYGNAQSGTTLRLVFAPGTLYNRPGADLVLFDAGNDLNIYLAASNYDNFSHQQVLSASTDTGLDRTYFFGGTGPTTFDVMAGTIDLTSLNVPPGQSVSEIQLFTEGPSNDPLGLGVLALPGTVPPDLRVSRSQSVPGGVVLDWSSSCTGGAGDYGIYEGTLGVWNSHAAADCHDDGLDTIETLTPSAGSRYFLVVARDTLSEGSYGSASNGVPRPRGTSTCVGAQDASACP